MRARISQAEFIALIAMMFATIAFSLDAMLPALPEIGAELSPATPNRAQLILTSFVLGIGTGTFLTGPISDAFGRKPVILCGAALYIGAATLAYFSTSLEVVLTARVLQGLGAAAPRVVSVAIMRDLYSGRQMARMMSIAMMIFTLFPAAAPLIGQGIIALAGWRSIFLAFIVFAAIFALWMQIRLPETLPRPERRPMRLPLLAAALRDMLTHPTVRLSIVVQTLCMSVLFTLLSTVQPIYDIVFGRSESFPLWFALIALVSASGSLLNAAVVVRFGMRRIVTLTLAVQIGFSGTMLTLSMMGLPQGPYFALFLLWQMSVFLMAGLTIGNLNAVAMEPMGHIAGMAASIIGGISTVAAAVIAAPVGLLFDGSITPIAGGIFAMAIAGFTLMVLMGRIEARLPA